MFGFSPFPCLPAVKVGLLQESLGRGNIALTRLQVGTARLLSVLKSSHFSSDFPPHPPLSPSVLLPCPLLQDSCCPLILTSEPSPCPPGPARRGWHLSSCLLRLFPIHVAHGHMKDCPGSLGYLLHILGHLSQEMQQVVLARARKLPKPCWDSPSPPHHQLLHHQDGVFTPRGSL